MSEVHIKSETVREYLLGSISDEKLLEEIEDLLFSDSDFCDRVELAEDELINDFVLNKLTRAEEDDFNNALEHNPERRRKLKLTENIREKAVANYPLEKPGIFDSIKSFFSRPAYAGTFGLLLLAALVSVIYFSMPSQQNELALLKDIYKNDRPVNARISGFEYAPYSATRSSDDNAKNRNKLRLIENRLLEAVEGDGNAASIHALGVFYLTQKKFDKAIKNLTKAVELDDQNSRFRNDLGTAYFEFAKNGKPEERLENLARANEEFSEVLEKASDNLDALFNKSDVLQELNLHMEARKSWNRYLKLDKSSKWVDEARQRLEKLNQKENSFKSNDEILKAFLNAVKENNEEKAWQIHNETKGVFNGTALHQQLTKRYLDESENNAKTRSEESLEALKIIGEFEKEKHADFFFADLADYYSNIDQTKIDYLLEAKKSLSAGVDSVKSGKYTDSIESFKKSKVLFLKAGNRIESNIAELWVTEMLPDVGKIEESQNRLNTLVSELEEKKYKVVLPTALYWLGVGKFRQKNFSAGIADRKRGLQIAAENKNQYELNHTYESLALIYNSLGEFNKSVNYLSVASNDNEMVYSNKAQAWRNLTSASQVLEKLNLVSTAIDFANEGLNFSKIHMAKTSAVDFSRREFIRKLSKKRKFDEALRFASEANEIALEKGEAPEHINVIADSFLEKANVESQMGNCFAALKDFEKAFEFYSKLPETTFSLYEVHKGKLLCFRKLNQQNNFQNELKTVLELSEEYRQNIREDDIRQAYFESEQIVYDVAIANALAESKQRGAFAFLEISKARSLLDFIKSEKSIAEIEKDFSAVSKPLSIEEIQKRMPESVQIVQYSLLEDKLAIWVLEKEKFQVFEKNIMLAELEKKILEYRRNILNKEKPETIETLAKEFFELLIPKNLDKEKTLCLVLDKSLHQIPFASLISQRGSYLIEDFPLLYSPSSSVFIVASENAKKKQSREGFLGVGNPRFDREENPNLADLPNAEDETLQIAHYYSNAKKFVGENAVKKEFLDNFENFEVIHFAGHFVANGESSVNSKLVFADESLRSFEFADKKLAKSKLVVLSACETAFEKINKSEGAIGIGRNFLAMGTPIVVASSWKVESEATKDLMIAFHKSRKNNGRSTVEALRHAQIEILKNDKTAAPYYWSAFSSIGGYTEY